MRGNRNFTDVVLDRAEEAGGREAFVFLHGSGTDQAAESVSYRDLDQSAKTLAGWLQSRGAAGERALIMQSSRRLFATSFLACLYAGAIAVPTAVPGGRRHHDDRVAGIVKDSGASCVLTDSVSAPEVSRLLARTGQSHVDCLAIDVPQAMGEWTYPSIGPDTVAFLQYTSGSTSAPRGVRITHRNLLANNEAISAALRTHPGARLGGWLPFDHDMGLIGQLLHPLWLGGSAVLIQPITFVKRPASWLEAIDTYGVSISGGPDFAYELCVRRVTDEQIEGLDLSGWETAVNGGEPVRAQTLRAFAERFAPAGLRPQALIPCYGLAETTLLATAATPGITTESLRADARALEQHRLREAAPGAPAWPVVCCGRPAVPETLRIVDPQTFELMPEGRIGEIWLRGDSVGDGYWNRPIESAQTFAAITEQGEPGFLRTGDLGVLHEGQLYVTGRLKDMIVVAGRNLYPQDLERTAQRVSALFGASSAFVVPGERERIVVVQELRARSRYDVDFDALAAAVQSSLAEEFEVQAGGVLLVRPGTVRRTTSGKVERATMRRLFLGGELEPLHQSVEPEILDLVGSGGRR